MGLFKAMREHFEAAKARIAWANRYINEFHEARNRFIESHTDILVTEDKIEEGVRIKEIILRKAKPVPDDVRFVFGDAVHNLRSTCDNLMQGIAESHGDTDFVKFPVLLSLVKSGPKDTGAFNDWRDKRSSICVEILDAIQALQPFNAYTRHHQNLIGRSHPIRVLHDLWNYDKHKCPLAADIASNRTTISAPMTDGSRRGEFRAAQTLDFDKPIARIPMDGTVKNFQVKASIDIVLAKGAPGSGMSAMNVLEDAHDFIANDIIGGLSTACGVQA